MKRKWRKRKRRGKSERIKEIAPETIKKKFGDIVVSENAFSEEKYADFCLKSRKNARIFIFFGENFRKNNFSGISQNFSGKFSEAPGSGVG